MSGRRCIAHVGTVAIWAIVAAATVLAAATSFAPLADHRSFTVLTGSMEPAIGVGSIVIDEPIAPLDARPGDVVTFPDPDDNSRLITHRLKHVRVEEGTAHMVTQGDANDAPERWDVALDAEIGRVAFHLPKIGYARSVLSGNVGRGLVLLVLLTWGALSLFDVWRRDAVEPEPEAQGSAA